MQKQCHDSERTAHAIKNHRNQTPTETIKKRESFDDALATTSESTGARLQLELCIALDQSPVDLPVGNQSH
ncbi:hypothetical protein SPRG_05377 [Saprolegnia parasitica CBS 223.65]|uniref:Uncharacterized protein n=1 Tax=Saprolegnia parasitica (strain CBS 223.65) TaxID=695850 RepID=A0A067CEG0_SAPPC|nr:hypothetical protein SPRG_05377 [Saprolegnia parasitica CBS 223.65]KDO29134.1 hypothetical protein SPRG_05377 [Saprolegnia parasitica CBS 223.65]|eukprot:XP_012200014.1 hypothetical protein SPRG_05377 [Saprolegnia parasitica CBS 223.65]